MTIKQLYYLTVAARAKSYSQAAQLLNINARSLRAALSELEAELGIEFFAAGQKTVQLTEAGKMFVVKAEKALAHFGNLKALVPERLYFQHNSLPGQKVFSNPACIESLVGALLDELYDMYPQIPLVLQEKRHETIFEAVAAETEAMGIVTIASSYFEQNFCSRYKTRLSWETLQLDEIVALVSDKSPLAHKSSLSLAEYLTYPLALNDHFSFEWMQELGIKLLQSLSVCLYSSNIELIWQFIAANQAVGFQVRSISAAEAQNRHMVTLPFKEKPTLMLITCQAKNHQPTLAENVLINALRNKVNN